MTPSTVDVETDPLDDAMRRGLMIVAKIIQNLANNIFFGKEQHMTALNGFLQAHIVHVTRFLSELNVRFSVLCALHSVTDCKHP